MPHAAPWILDKDIYISLYIPAPACLNYCGQDLLDQISLFLTKD